MFISAVVLTFGQETLALGCVNAAMGTLDHGFRAALCGPGYIASNVILPRQRALIILQEQYDHANYKNQQYELCHYSGIPIRAQIRCELTELAR